VGLLFLIGLTNCAMGYEVAKQQNIPRVLDLPQFYPELSAQFKYAKNVDGFLDYFDIPGVVCTVISPDNNAIANTMKYLGRNLGLFLQNKTMQEQVFNYHVIPDKMLLAEDLADQEITALNTKADEPLWIVKRGDQLYAAFARDYMVPLKMVDIKVRGCVVHTVDEMLLIPPSLIPTFEGWLSNAGAPDLALPESQWAPPLPPVPGSAKVVDGVSANGASANGASAYGAPAVQTEASATKAQQPAAPSAPAPSPAGQAQAGMVWWWSVAAGAILLASLVHL
jgi:hypothetical protein